VGKTVYKIEEFPDDDRLWRIEWIGGVRYNATVPSDPLMDVCLTRLPAGETNPLSARSRSSEAKFIAKIGVGLLPFISIASVWQKRRPVATNCAAYRRQLTIETKLCRTEMLCDLTANYNGIPNDSCLGPIAPFAGTPKAARCVRIHPSIDITSTGVWPMPSQPHLLLPTFGHHHPIQGAA
jgi:hypothetical protein